jgi:CHAD domain-containing protein
VLYLGTPIRATGIKLKMRNASFTRPIQIFHEQVEALDAAMVISRASPKKEPVHDLRTAARCVEAQLTLLDLLRGLPPHKDQSDEVRKRLKKVRQATSVVRDLDVQRDLIQGDASAKAKWGKTSRDDSMRRDAKQLRKHLKKRREYRAIELVQVIRAEEPKLALALLNLEDALKPAKDRAVSATQLAMRIERWFCPNAKHFRQAAAAVSTRTKKKNHTANHVQSIEMLNEDALHNLRKRAKLCRYMVESLPPDFLMAKQMASRFKVIHEAGGYWHDWLLLLEIAANREGKHAGLTERYAEHQAATLADYRSRLVDVLPGVVSADTHRAGSSVS